MTPASTEPVASTAAKTRLVIADDHDLVRAGLRLMLEAIDGVEVIGEARNGSELIATTERLDPDVVITDLSMPGLGGLEAIEALRRQNTPVRVIVLSMYDTPEVIRRVLRAGANGYVLKGAPAQEIEYAIRQVLVGANYFSPQVSQRLVEREDLRAQDVLTERQIEVLTRLVRGQTSKEIGFELHLSSKTVDVHRAAIMNRLGLRDLASLTLYAVRTGLIDPRSDDVVGSSRY